MLKGSEVTSPYSIFWYNGKKDIKIGGSINEEYQEISIPTKRLGLFIVKEEKQDTTVGLTDVYPKTFTPNGDGYNDEVNFIFSNPANLPIVARIYDLKGAEIAILNEGQFSGNSLSWTGKDKSGYIVRSGIYIYQIEIGDNVINGTVVLAK